MSQRTLSMSMSMSVSVLLMLLLCVGRLSGTRGATESVSVSVQVTSLQDSFPNASQCEAQASEESCSLRSAFSLCSENGGTISECVIGLPPLGELTIDPSLGPAEVVATNGFSLVLRGAGATVSGGEGLLHYRGNGAEGASLCVQNATFVNFNSSVFVVEQVEAVFDNTNFQNNSCLQGEENDL